MGQDRNRGDQDRERIGQGRDRSDHAGQQRETTGSNRDRTKQESDRTGRERDRVGQDGDRSNPDRNRVGQDKKRTDEQDRARVGKDSRTTTSKNSSTALTTEQRSRVREVIFREGNNVPRVSNVNFSVSVGTRVPASVHLVRVPPAVVEIYPEWRNYDYFVVDEDVAIVDPGKKEIVALVPTGSSRANASGSSRRAAPHGSGIENLSSADIREVQLILIRNGFLKGEADGVIGVRTKEAVVRFQKERGLEATGTIDTRTVETINLSGKIRAQGGAGGQSSTTGSAGPQQHPDQQSGRAGGQTDEQPSRNPSNAGDNRDDGANSVRRSHPSESDNNGRSSPSTTGSGGNQPGTPDGSNQPSRQGPEQRGAASGR